MIGRAARRPGDQESDVTLALEENVLRLGLGADVLAIDLQQRGREKERINKSQKMKR